MLVVAGTRSSSTSSTSTRHPSSVRSIADTVSGERPVSSANWLSAARVTAFASPPFRRADERVELGLDRCDTVGMVLLLGCGVDHSVECSTPPRRRSAHVFSQLRPVTPGKSRQPAAMKVFARICPSIFFRGYGARVTKAIDLAAAIASFDDQWSPRTVATMNDYDVRVVRTSGEFTWHRHPDTDELFVVLAGSLTIELEQEDD